ncbi:MAG: SpoIID/LytB domain-containing protein [Oscillospiraceae bacterium]|nr:SpoIID/LytB domain-containing protein [Oscillospiraceae bacterium]
MNKTIKRIVSAIMALCIIFAAAVFGSPQMVHDAHAANQAVFTPPVSTMRIGLAFGTNAVASANLQNADGMGSGFYFGFFHDREFVPIGAYTNATAISMMMDRNMTWHPDSREYREGTEGSVVVGVFHIQLDMPFDTYAEARAEANLRTRQNARSFVKYYRGRFFVCVGQYTTRDAAESAQAAMNLTETSHITAGSQHTITVVETGTNNILFEFDYGATRHLGVMPRSQRGVNPETWFRGNRYHGGFQYARLTGGAITVVNFVNIEDYVKGVVPYEMPNNWPIEALKAQAVTARTFAMGRLDRYRAQGFDICRTEHCQVYRGRGEANARTDTAVRETAGVYVTINGRLVGTYYASSNGGASENSENVWVSAYSHLRGVIDPFEAEIAYRIPNYHWEVSFTSEQITRRLRDRGFNVGQIVHMEVSEYSPTGNAIAVTMRDENGRNWTFRRRNELMTALGVRTQRFDIGERRWVSNFAGVGGIHVNSPGNRLPSRAYAVGSDGVSRPVTGGYMYAITGTNAVERLITAPQTGGGGTIVGGGNGMIDGVFTIRGTGNGHNVGMSQWGAYAMASLHGKTYVEIIQFYFTGVTVG